MVQHISNISLSDGFGSQYQHILCVCLISMANGWVFVYNPLKYVEHNYDKDPKFTEKLEQLMNIRPFYQTLTDELKNTAHVTMCDMTAKYVVDRQINLFANEHHLFVIRSMFWANKTRETVFSQFPENKCHVAVHIRRLNQHDVTLPFVEAERFNTTDDFYLKAIQRIRDEYGVSDSGAASGKELLFHVYSQGNDEQFRCYESADTVLHINDDLTTTFVQMAAADILVTSFSSFSYVAGFINDGKVYYHPFWHPPRSCWIGL